MAAFAAACWVATAEASEPRPTSVFYGRLAGPHCSRSALLVALDGAGTAWVYWPPRIEQTTVTTAPGSGADVRFEFTHMYNLKVSFAGTHTPAGTLSGRLRFASANPFECRVELARVSPESSGDTGIHGVFSNVDVHPESGDWVGHELLILPTASETIVLFSDVTSGDISQVPDAAQASSGVVDITMGETEYHGTLGTDGLDLEALDGEPDASPGLLIPRAEPFSGIR